MTSASKPEYNYRNKGITCGDKVLVPKRSIYNYSANINKVDRIHRRETLTLLQSITNDTDKENKKPKEKYLTPNA